MTRLTWMKLLRPAVTRFPGLFYRTSYLTGLAMWIFWPDIRQNVIRNQLVLCDGDQRRAKRESLRVCVFVSQYYVDLTQVSRLNLNRFEQDHLKVWNPQYLAAVENPGPLLVISAHMGNGELEVQALIQRGRDFVALVEKQEPPEWSEYILALRSAAGARFYEAGYQGVRLALEALKQGQAVGLMGDRDIQGTGIWVTLCGRRVRLPRGPWELARRTNALVLPAFGGRRRMQDFDVFLEEPFRIEKTEDAEGDIRHAVERFAEVLERHLKRDPGQWLVLEDFWKVHGCEQS